MFFYYYTKFLTLNFELKIHRKIYTFKNLIEIWKTLKKRVATLNLKPWNFISSKKETWNLSYLQSCQFTWNLKNPWFFNMFSSKISIWHQKSIILIRLSFIKHTLKGMETSTLIYTSLSYFVKLYSSYQTFLTAWKTKSNFWDISDQSRRQQ